MTKRAMTRKEAKAYKAKKAVNKTNEATLNEAMTQETMTKTRELITDCMNNLAVKRELTLSFTPSMRFADAQSFGALILETASLVGGQHSFRCALQTDENFGVTSLHVYEEHNAEAA